MARERVWRPAGVEEETDYGSGRPPQHRGGEPRIEGNPFDRMRTAFHQEGSEAYGGQVGADLRSLAAASRKHDHVPRNLAPEAPVAPQQKPREAPAAQPAGRTHEEEQARWEAMKSDAAKNDAARGSARERVRIFDTLSIGKPDEQPRNVVVGRPKGVWNWIKAKAGFGQVFLLDEHGRPMDETEGFYQIGVKDGRLVGKKMENGKRVEVPVNWQTGRDARSAREHLKNAGHVVDRYGVGGR